METIQPCKYKRVMVIDDAPIDRLVAEKVMTKFSFSEEVINLDSALEGLNYLFNHRFNPDKLPQLIFLDINMPEMNGFEFLEKYNYLPLNVRNRCIIVMLTSSMHPEDRKQADTNEYVHGYINKPLNPQKLEELFTSSCIAITA